MFKEALISLIKVIKRYLSSADVIGFLITSFRLTCYRLKFVHHFYFMVNYSNI